MTQNDVDVGATPALLSHAQEEMMVGAAVAERRGNEGMDKCQFLLIMHASSGVLNYKCDHKMLREQILAALRKLDRCGYCVKMSQFLIISQIALRSVWLISKKECICSV